MRGEMGVHVPRVQVFTFTGICNIQIRHEGLSSEVTDIAWKAQQRLCKRYQRLVKKGKHKNLVVSAIAREMSAYLWSIAHHVPLQEVDPTKRLSRQPR